MASNDEYQQQRSFKDEYPKRFVLDGKELVKVRDGFGGFCTFIPMPFPGENKSENFESPKLHTINGDFYGRKTYKIQGVYGEETEFRECKTVLGKEIIKTK